MNSPRRRQDRPVRFVSLAVTFRATKDEARELKKEFPSVVYKDHICKIKIEAGTPEEVVLEARRLLEKVRSPPRIAKGFK